MNPQELAVVVEQLILEADAKYVNTLGKIQAKLYLDLVSILKDLELEDGYIKQTAANRKVLSLADRKLQETYAASSYTSAVSRYVAIVPTIDIANTTYFTAVDPAFNPARQFLKNIQKDLIATVEKYVLQDGLQSQVISPLSQIMSQNVNTGGSFSGFLEQVREYVVGTPEVDNRALSYTRTYVRDSLFTYSRTYQQAVTTDLGLEYYFYSGGVMDTTREFCLERVGQYFHKKEIEAWAELEWKGKKKGTTEASIFLFAGGWNCTHQIIPVSNAVVPADVIARQQL